MLTILAQSTGPYVEADQEVLDYEDIEVLKDVTKKLKITNKSKIPAEYTAFTKQKESIWKVIQRHGTLQPDDEREIEVVCNADDITKHSDTLHIIINNGVDLEVQLKARGKGSTLYCKQPLKIVDFGLSKIIGPNESSLDPFGTLSYVAPEVLLQKPYGKEVDLWSLGVISYLLLSRVLPFDDEEDKEIARQTIQDAPDFSFEPWDTVTPEAKDIVKSK